MIAKNNECPSSAWAGAFKIIEAAIIVAAVFAADIALARIVDVALDAIHR